MSIRVELPFPPPLSACFSDFVYRDKKSGRWTARRIETKRYKEWQGDAHTMIRSQMRDQEPMLDQLVKVRVRLVAPDARARDAGNLDKAICDQIVKAGLITDDSNRYVRRLLFEWEDEGCPTVVFITPFQPKGMLL